MGGDFNIFSFKNRFACCEHFNVVPNPLRGIVCKCTRFCKNPFKFESARWAFFPQIKSLIAVYDYFCHELFYLS